MTLRRMRTLLRELRRRDGIEKYLLPPMRTPIQVYPAVIRLLLGLALALVVAEMVLRRP